MREFSGFDDVTDLLGCGVYVLELRGRVVHVGYCRAGIERIAKHIELRNADVPSWFPIKGIRFDRVHFRRCASDVAETIVAELTARYLKLNEPSNATAA